MDLMGRGTDHRIRSASPLADLVSGLTAAQGILTDLYAAKVDPRGQRVACLIYEAVAALLTFNASIYFATGNSPRRRGNEHEELDDFTKLLADHGVPGSGTYFDADASRRMLLDRLSAASRSHEADDLAFCFVPMGILTGPSSILIAPRDHGVRTTLLA